MQRTLKRELKVPEIVNGEAFRRVAGEAGSATRARPSAASTPKGACRQPGVLGWFTPAPEQAQWDRGM